MSRTRNLFAILVVFLIILILIALTLSYWINWIKSNWSNIIYAFFVALFLGIFVELAYQRFFSKNKLLQTTLTPNSNPHEYQAKLVLKEKQEFLIKEYDRNFGRQDFLGVVLGEDLNYMGKNHFKIMKMDDGFYIEDLNSKNGTKLNGDEIKGKGQLKLENKDEITVANTLKIKYLEEEL